MSAAFFGMIGMWEVVAILAVVLVLFGAKKLPELARGLGTGIKEFRKATREVNEDLQRVFEEDQPSTPPRRLPPQDKSQNNASQQSTPESKS